MDPPKSVADARARLYAIDARDMAEEIKLLQRKYRDAVPLTIKPFEAYVLLACLQLAWRHPNLSDTQRQIVEGFGRQLQPIFDQPDTPLLHLTAEMGWVREMDH